MYKDRLKEYFLAHKDALLADVSTLVAINSEDMPPEPGMPYGRGPAECLAAAQTMMEGYGFPVTNYDNYVIAADFGPAPRKLDILAHLDVVPAGEGWTVTDPFTPKIVDGRIYGRGTCDDKGPALCALYAMRAIKELGIPLNSGVRLILGSNEECGSGDLVHYFAKEVSAPMTFSPDADYPVINVEKGMLRSTFTAQLPTDEPLPRLASFHSGTVANVVPDRAVALVEGLDIEVIEEAAKSSMAKVDVQVTCTAADNGVSIQAKGRNAHASTPDRGENALTALVAFLAQLPLADSKTTQAFQSLAKLFPHGDFHGAALGVALEEEVAGKTTLTLDILNLADGKLKGVSDSRVCLAGTDENTTAVIAAKLAEAGFTPDPDMAMIPPHHVPADSELVQALLKVYTDVTGKEGKPIAIGGGTYVHHIDNGVAFGCMVPEVDNHLHGADEFMVIDAMLESCLIFAQAIIALCG